MPNPYSDDLGSPHLGGGQHRKPKREDDATATPYTDVDDTYWRIKNIWHDEDETTERNKKDGKLPSET